MTFRPCVVIPVFNHDAGFSAVVARIVPLGLPVIAVNDGSAPAASAAIHRLAAANSGIDVVDHPRNMGKGAAVLTGLRAARQAGYSHAVQIDADGQHDPGDIPRFLAAAQEHPGAVVLGCPRYDASVPKGRLIARYLTHVWIWIETLSFTIRDSMCGFRVYPLAAVLQVADGVSLGRRMDFDPEILVRLHWAGVPMVTLPTRVIYPEGGVSHFRIWHDNWLITRMHTRLFFGMLRRLPGLLARSCRTAPELPVGDGHRQ